MGVWVSRAIAGVYIGGDAAQRRFRCPFARKSTACISRTRMRDLELRASLAAVGALQPAFEYAGELIDGRRRKVLCDELGASLEIRVCHSPQEACSTLYALHPMRAIELARREGATTLLELARICGTTTSAIARELQPTQPKKSHKRQVKDATARASASSRMMRRLVTFEPELYALAQEAAREIGHGNFAKLVRDSVWRTVRERVSGAPLHQPRRVQPANGARRRAG
jgi:hypothetical protein